MIEVARVATPEVSEWTKFADRFRPQTGAPEERGVGVPVTSYNDAFAATLTWIEGMKARHPRLAEFLPDGHVHKDVLSKLNDGQEWQAVEQLRRAAIEFAAILPQRFELTEPEVAVLAISVEACRDLADLVGHRWTPPDGRPDPIRLPRFVWSLAADGSRSGSGPGDLAPYKDLFVELLTAIGWDHQKELAWYLRNRVLEGETDDARHVRPAGVLLLWLSAAGYTLRLQRPRTRMVG